MLLAAFLPGTSLHPRSLCFPLLASLAFNACVLALNPLILCFPLLASLAFNARILALHSLSLSANGRFLLLASLAFNARILALHSLSLSANRCFSLLASLGFDAPILTLNPLSFSALPTTVRIEVSILTLPPLCITLALRFTALGLPAFRFRPLPPFDLFSLRSEARTLTLPTFSLSAFSLPAIIPADPHAAVERPPPRSITPPRRPRPRRALRPRLAPNASLPIDEDVRVALEVLLGHVEEDVALVEDLVRGIRIRLDGLDHDLGHHHWSEPARVHATRTNQQHHHQRICSSHAASDERPP